jgi:aspartyl protease family protein
MEGDGARLIYLVLLLLLVAWYFVGGRAMFGTMMRHAASWLVIFLVAIAAAALWGDLRSVPTPQQSVFAADSRVEVPRAPDGHYYLTLDVNGRPVNFVVDTGATDIVLSQADAIAIGIDPAKLYYAGRAGTANGEVRTARVRVDEIALGPIVDRDVPLWVNSGEMTGSLLGMAYLQRFESLLIEDDKLILRR